MNGRWLEQGMTLGYYHLKSGVRSGGEGGEKKQSTCSFVVYGGETCYD